MGFTLSTAPKEISSVAYGSGTVMGYIVFVVLVVYSQRGS